MLRDILAPFKQDGFGVCLKRGDGSHTWHTNLDTYERIIEDDAKKAAVVVATAVYHLAMRDELLPRFTKDAMPPLPKPTSE